MEKLLGKELWGQIKSQTLNENINEIRIRLNRPVLIKCTGKTICLDYYPNLEYLNEIIDIATAHSRYAYEKEISNGYLEYGEGIRIGISGRGKVNEKSEIVFQQITSVCIRIPHRVIAKDKTGFLFECFDNTLIIGPPFSGKTTLIREIADKLSNQQDILIIDERYEIAGKNLTLINGNRIDIIQGIPKMSAYENVIRSMSPSIVVCDEIFTDSDFYAMDRLALSGIKCLASFHAREYSSIPEYLKKIFLNYITLNSIPTPGSITSIVRLNG